MQTNLFEPQKQVQKKKPQPIKEEAKQFDVESAWRLYQSLIKRFSGFS